MEFRKKYAPSTSTICRALRFARPIPNDFASSRVCRIFAPTFRADALGANKPSK